MFLSTLLILQPTPSLLSTAMQPLCLTGLTDIEEMLIARIKPIMHVRYTTGRQLCYKDHIVNLPQDISDVAQRLPRLPQDLDLLIIRRQDDNLTRHVDYLCRRHVVHNALLYKIANDPNYADLQQPDNDALLSLPVHGSVAHMIPAYVQPNQSAQAAPAPSGPSEAVDVLPEQNDDDDTNE